jgi:hypothetical protein
MKWLCQHFMPGGYRMKFPDRRYIVLWLLLFLSAQIVAQRKYPAVFAGEFSSAADLLVRDERDLPYTYLAPLSKEELALLDDFVYALYGIKPVDSVVWHQLPKSAKAIFKVASHTMSERHKLALELVQSFLQSTDIPPSNNSDFFELLNGCWQENIYNVGSIELSVLTIYSADRSYSFNGIEQTYYSNGFVSFSGKTDHSGFLTIDSGRMEFEMHSQTTTTATTTTLRNKNTGEVDSVLTDRKTKTETYSDYQYFNRNMGPLRKIETDGLTLYFFKLGGVCYWRIKSNPEECD